MPSSLLNKSANTRRGGRGSKRVRHDVTISFSQAVKQADKVMDENSKAKATHQKYNLYFNQAVKFVQEFAKNEADKEAAWKQHQSEQSQPENEIVDDKLSSVDADLSPDAPVSEMPPRFETAFDGPPKIFTPLALSMFLSEKCVNQGCKNGVAYAVYSSMLDHYDNLDGNDKYRGDWVCDEEAGTCSGNPARSGRVQRMLHSLKKRDAEESGDRKHSRAMTHENMEKVYAHVNATCPSKEVAEQFYHTGNGYYQPVSPELLSERGKQVFYMSFSTTSFCTWTRCHETCNLQFKHLDFNMPPKRCSNGQVFPRFSINLRNRKNWQNKMESGELGVEGHNYNIYPHPDEPAVDAYHHLHEWLRFYSDIILRRPLKDDDYIFPTINFSKITANPEKPCDHTTVQKMISEMATAAGLPNSEKSKYTTHCFRRGGAQYRFMCAPFGKRWSLARIRWWAGWAEGETGDTMIRYLLDELNTYEEDHSDALCPVDEAANRSHLGEDRALRPFTAEDGKQLYEHCDKVLTSQFDNLTKLLVETVQSHTLATACPPPSSSFEQCPSPNADTAATGPVRSSRPHPSCVPYPPAVATTQTSHHSTRVFQPRPSTNQAHQVSMPSQQHLGQCNMTALLVAAPTIHWQPPIQLTDNSPPTAPALPPPQERRTLPRISKRNPELQWKTVVDDWELPQPDRCPIPLREWDPAWYKDTNQAMMYHTRKIIAEEYIMEYGRNDARFLQDYPQHVRGITPLFKAIQARRIKDGRANSRAKRTA